MPVGVVSFTELELSPILLSNLKHSVWICQMELGHNYQVRSNSPDHL
jgi:hypothetical protein